MSWIMAHAQYELYIVDKKKPTKEMRMPKGVIVKGRLYSGKKFSGVLMTVSFGYLVLSRPSSSISIDQIAWIRGSVYAGSDLGTYERYSRRFDTVYYDLITK